MTLEEFAKLLERLNGGEEPLVPFNLSSGLRQLDVSTPDTFSQVHHDWGFPAWARFFREVGAADYSEVVAP